MTHMSKIMVFVSGFFHLISLSPSSIWVVVNDRLRSFLWLNSIPSCLDTFSLSILQLRSFHYCELCCNKTWDCRYLFSRLTSFSIRYIFLVVESHYGSIFDFWGISILFSIMAMLIYIPTNGARIPFLHIPMSICCLCLFDHSYGNRREAVSHCGLDLHFPDD